MMLAYDITYIHNLAIVKKAKQWYSQQLISTEQMSAILKNYKSEFYTPPLFIKIGLFFFTFIAIIAAVGFYSLFFSSLYSSSHKVFPVFTCFLFAAICIVVLELFIKEKKVYRSGIDECLLYTALFFLFSGVWILISDVSNDQNNFLLLNSIAVPILVAAVIRYSDQLVSIMLGLCIYTIFFLLLLKLGEIAKMIMPFALMLISAPFYVTAKKYKLREELFYWKNCLAVFECLALLIFYLACNYFVIREASIEFFDLKLGTGEDIPLAFIFYILTAIVPVAYVYYGLKKKDKLFLWIGLLLVAAAVLTFKYYFSLGHPEITLTIAGALMIIVAYLAINYLKIPKHGLTFIEEPDEDHFLKSNAEALLIAQTFTLHSSQPGSTDPPEFGGGSFGGAGSSGTF
jgi:uncharacterized membrane protein YgcG